MYFLTRNLPSFLKQSERAALYLELKAWLNPGGVIFVAPDIMELTFRHSFRYKIASCLLRLRHLASEEGDTLRVNLDHYTGDDHFVFYHYYPRSEAFILEAYQAGFQAKPLPLGFFELKFLSDQ